MADSTRLPCYLLTLMLTYNLEPEFPSLPDGYSWMASVKQAHEIISDTYHRAHRLLCLNDSEAIQLLFHIDAITNNAIPLLQSLESSEELVDLISREWLAHGAKLCGNLVFFL